MRRSKRSIQQLIQTNKEEMLLNKKAIEEIEDKVDKKLLSRNKSKKDDNL
ncbi:FbpB family small basic protein [Pontibacillus yanchengensis]|uniref:FbpB family small basic protein n=2 Tax=Pontibacillus yanchengensis TaxID=462910 RepID=A0ACC7VCP8_9BACI|nr:FbpB family small basic protein [Pontibacillus yanchengensis]MYL35156.1 FbpB family small basic protein [Pontibacillus yanchengensis]MYL52477.1 FbpB family small basic protein [Pontibacillus yanchengensis]